MRFFFSLFLMLSFSTMMGCPDTVQEGEVSECGGFPGTAEFAITDPGHDGMRDYCDAQVLYWEFADGTLTILDSRVMLNCCGQHSVSIIGGDTITIYEQDDPEPGNMRCDCRCAYDFRAELDGLLAGPVEIELLLHVTDVTDDPTQLWSGSVDLTDGSGEIVIDATPEPDFCE
jgi:hypothetical protein